MFLLALRLRWLAKHNQQFLQKLDKRQVVMQWRTYKGSPSRWYHLQTTGVTSASGLHGTPTVTLGFKDAAYAFATIRAAAKSQMAFMQGMQQGNIKIDGDAAEVMWFMSLMKYIAPKKKRSRR